MKYKIGDIKKWRGTRDSDTGEIDSGYLYIITKVSKNGHTAKGIRIEARNRSEAIEKYRANPINPNNYNYAIIGTRSYWYDTKEQKTLI